MLKKILGVFLLVFLFTGKIQAADFAATLQSTYSISEASGSAQVTHDFVVTNTTPTTFIDSYQLTFNHDNLQNLILDPKNEDVEKTIDKNNGQTQIALQFNNEVVGEGKKRAWSVNYNDPNVAAFTGQVAEINIPLLASNEQYENYKLIVRIPSHLGEPSKINLEPKNVKQVGGNLTEYTWENTGAQKQLTITFGARQMIDFDLHYQLLNQSGENAFQQIALPGDDAWQSLNYKQIMPAPANLELDPDGNYLATYELSAGEELFVNANGQAVLIEKNQIAAQPEIDKYLLAANFWEIKDETVQNFASETGSAAGIYQVLTENFTSSEENEQTRQGAKKTLAAKAGTNEDFVDVFVAAARAQNIPARRVVGWINESTDNTFHFWAEWYDAASEAWRRVDPSLANTAGRDYFDNFDLFHFALVKNGYYGSELPNPPQLVNIAYNNQATESTPLAAPQISIQLRQLGALPLPGFYDLIITNPNGRTLSGLNFKLSSNQDGVIVTQNQENLTLLPFQTQKLALSVYNQGWLKFWQSSQLTVIAQDLGENFYVEEKQDIISFSFLGLAAAGGVVAFAFTAWSILVARRKK